MCIFSMQPRWWFYSELFAIGINKEDTRQAQKPNKRKKITTFTTLTAANLSSTRRSTKTSWQIKMISCFLRELLCVFSFPSIIFLFECSQNPFIFAVSDNVTYPLLFNWPRFGHVGAECGSSSIPLSLEFPFYNR